MPTIPVSESADILLRPRTIIDFFNRANQLISQQAATSGRMLQTAKYSLAGPSDQASLVNITGGALAFLFALLAIPLTLSIYLSRYHVSQVELSGGILASYIIGNLILGYAMLSGHELLHAAIHRMMGGNPVIMQTERNTLQWSAPSQGFSRQSFLVVIVGGPIIFLFLWFILVLILPGIAAVFIVSNIVNLALFGQDLWLGIATMREKPENVVFAPIAHGFAAFAITSDKPPRKQKTSAK